MTNSEIHRQFYLAAAGIRVWYAKRPLPGAAPSPEFQSAEDQTAEEAELQGDMEVVLPPEVKARQDKGATTHRSVNLQALMASPVENEGEALSPKTTNERAVVDDLPAVGETVPESTVLEKTASTRQDLVSPISAHLGFWTTESYLLISQWSDEASDRLQDALARNLLGALRQSDVGERLMLQWPVFRNPNIPGNSPEDMQEVLSGLVSSCGDRSVILLGVLNGAQESQRNHCLQSVLSRVGVDFPYSLAELSATPVHKRDLWNALKSRYSI